MLALGTTNIKIILFYYENVTTSTFYISYNDNQYQISYHIYIFATISFIMPDEL